MTDKCLLQPCMWVHTGCVVYPLVSSCSFTVLWLAEFSPSHLHSSLWIKDMALYSQKDTAGGSCLNLSKLLLLVLLLFLTDKHRKEQHRQEQLSTKFLKLSEVANPVGVDETTFLSGLSHKNKLLAMSATHGLYNYSVNLPGRSCMALSWTLLSVIYIFCS